MEITDKIEAAQGPHREVTFKAYDQNQAWLLPPTLGELIPAGHIVRLVNDAIEGMDLEPIIEGYEGGGSSYHPRMMIKVLVFGYIEKRYSSREIEKALKENICFMWLSGMQQPDHNTLNRFRNSQLKQTVKEVFSHVLSLLVKQGYVRLEEYYLDGTKMESVAGRYSYVWAKNVERHKGALLDKIAQIIEQIEVANQSVESPLEDDSEKPKQESRTISDSYELAKTIGELNKKLKEQKIENKELTKQVKKLEQDHLPKLQSYEDQEELLDGRSSYSKTDIDATFMRTKDDHLGNGQLKPCYNIQLGTEDQFIVNYTLHQTPSDTATFTDHMNDTLSVLESIEAPEIKRVCTDAGYGSEENYEYLEEKQIEAYVKYPGYYKQTKGAYKDDPFHPSNLHYNATDNYYVCPMGQHMSLQSISTQKTKTGYEQQVHIYQAKQCQDCPLRGQCHQAKTNRTIRVNHKAAAYRKIAKENLASLQGIRMRRKRGIDTESVFGHIKQDRQFRRFLLASLHGVSTETGLLAIAHNIKKWWIKRCKVVYMQPLPPAIEAKCIEMYINSANIQALSHLKAA